MSNYPASNSHNHEEEIDIRQQIGIYLRHWPWFLICIAVCLAGAFLYLRYTTPVYLTKATMIILDDGKKGGSVDAGSFADLGMLNALGTNSIQNEIGLLKSRRLMESVAENLNLNIRYFEEGSLPLQEVYENIPFNLQVLSVNEGAHREQMYKIQILDSTHYVVSNNEIGFNKTVSFGNPLVLPFAEILLTPKFSNGPVSSSKDFLIHFGNIENAAAAYSGKLGVQLTEQGSTLIELSLQDPVRAKARDILNNLIYQYNQEAIEDKNQVSLNTAEFIEERLAIISSELDSVEAGKKEFKVENRLTDIEAESEMFMQSISEFQKEKIEVETQLELANSMIDYLNHDSNQGLLPSNLGFIDPTLVTAINNYNQTILERNRILTGSTKENPVIVNLNNQISQIRNNIMESLQNLKNSMLISQKDLTAREARVDAKIAGVPLKEKQFRNIERQQSIKEALYLFLLQKREETNLSLAATAPKAKIVDSAYSFSSPVSPKSNIIIFASVILGVLIPFFVVYLRNLLNNKVQGRTDLEKVTKEIPIAGEIPKLKKGQIDLIENNDRSVLAESFRILHTNMQYLLVNTSTKEGGNVIFVTSTVKGEGKTFTAFNLALTLANTGDRVLLMGADLRNPQLQRYEQNAKEQLGVSDYLIKKDIKLQDIIHNSQLNQALDILPSGSIPPNPTELWRQKKTSVLFEEIESRYDYIVVDTAPSLLVSDTLLINKFADLTLYVVRAGYTQNKLLDFSVEAKNRGKLNKMAYVLNDVEAGQFGYGNKYGYYYAYAEEQKNFWSRLKKRAALW